MRLYRGTRFYKDSGKRVRDETNRRRGGWKHFGNLIQHFFTVFVSAMSVGDVELGKVKFGLFFLSNKTSDGFQSTTPFDLLVTFIDVLRYQRSQHAKAQQQDMQTALQAMSQMAAVIHHQTFRRGWAT